MFDTSLETLYLPFFSVHIANTSMIRFSVDVITVSDLAIGLLLVS